MKDFNDDELLHVTYFLITIVLIILFLIIFGSNPAEFKDRVNMTSSIVSALAALIGIPYLIRNFITQRESNSELRRQQLEIEREKSFERFCKSIEIGLSYVTNIQNNITGAPAIIKYGELNTNGIVDLDTTLNELGVVPLKSVTAALSSLVLWTKQDHVHYRFYDFYRVRFVPILLALEQIVPAETFELSKQELFTKYGNNSDKYSFIISIWLLHQEDFMLWGDIVSHTQAQARK